MIVERYPIPAEPVRVEEEIKRSRFITSLAPAPTVDAARALIAEVSAEFASANHHCWAYVVGPPGSTREIGMSDDGEPHGTAGRPMLNVLQHSGIGDIAAVVTRFFGGVLLGPGGLVRAYSGGVQLALESLPVVQRVVQAEVTIVCDYAAITPLQRMLPEYEAAIVHQEYATDATFTLRLPQERLAALAAALTDLTNGQILIDVTRQNLI